MVNFFYVLGLFYKKEPTFELFDFQKEILLELLGIKNVDTR